MAREPRVGLGVMSGIDGVLRECERVALARARWGRAEFLGRRTTGAGFDRVDERVDHGATRARRGR